MRNFNWPWIPVLAVCIVLLCIATFAGESPYNPQGNAGAHYYCSSDPAQSTIFFSSAFDVSPGTDSARVSDAFKQSLADEYAYDGDVYCFGKFKTLDAAQTGQKKRLADLRAANKAKVVETGWAFGAASAPVSPAAATSAPSGGNAGAQPAAAAGPENTTLAVRMLEEVDSAKYSGKPYRGMVTTAASAGNGVTIPAGSMAMVTLAHGQSGWTAQIASLMLKGQTMNVSSGPASVMNSKQSMATGAVNTVSSALGNFGFGHKKNTPPSTAEAIASGLRIFLPPGTQLQFALNAVSSTTPSSGNPNAASTTHPATASASPPSTSSPAAPVGNLTAKVTETLLGPHKPAGQSVVSPDGGHYAVFSMHGSREIIIVDNVPGPDFDHAGHAAGSTIDFVFSQDGKHSCYIAQRGNDVVEIRDGKEAGVITSVKPGSGQGTAWVESINQGWIYGGGASAENHQCLVSASGAHMAVVGPSQDGQHNYVFLDGVKSPAYRIIDLNQIAFVGEKLVYVAQTADQKWHAVVNENPGAAYDKINSLTLNRENTHYAFVTQNSSGNQVVVDGVPGTVRAHAGNGIQYLTLASNGRCAYVWDKATGGPHGITQVLVVDDKEISEDIQPFAGEDPTQVRNLILYMLFSPDGKRVAYTKRVPGGVAAVIDGKAGRAYDTIGVMEFSPDSKHAFAVGSRQLNFVVLDGQEMDGWNTVKSFKWSNEGGRLAFTAYSAGDGFHFVVDGKKSPRYYSAMDNTLSFSPDSKHYVYAACTMYMKCAVVMDGNETPVPDIAPFTTRSQPHFDFPPIFWSSDSSRLAYAHTKADGTSGTVFIINGQEVMHNTGLYEYPGFSPDSKHFATIYWTGHAYALFLDGQTGAQCEDLLEVNRNVARFENSHAYRFLAVKQGSVYRVTVDLGG